jgi:hypothetical protein
MEPGQIHRENAGYLIAASSLEDRFHETNRIDRMELKLTDLILRRRTDLGFTRDRHIKYASRLQPTCGVPSRGWRLVPSLVAVLRDARNPSRCALLRTRLVDASI